MANTEHLDLIKRGVDTWNRWREDNPGVRPDLRHAELKYRDLTGANLERALLTEAYLDKAKLIGANLNGAYVRHAQLRRTDFSGAHLIGADLSWANLGAATFTGAANLTHAELVYAYLVEAELTGADLTRANLSGADLRRAKLEGATLDGADLSGANLGGAKLQDAVLTGADLRFARLVGTFMENATLTGCQVYGISTWDLKLQGAKQSDLIITPYSEPATITVDSLEVAQFIYLLLNNQKLRDVIDTFARKAVLILGNFSPDRKTILDAIRDALRQRGYLPILFDFDKPSSKSTTETVAILARLSRFIVADLTEPKCIPWELAHISPTTIVQPLLKVSEKTFSMYPDIQQEDPSILPIQRYVDRDDLIAAFDERVIAPAENEVRESAPKKARLLTESWLSEETEAR